MKIKKGTVVAFKQKDGKVAFGSVTSKGGADCAWVSSPALEKDTVFPLESLLPLLQLGKVVEDPIMNMSVYSVQTIRSFVAEIFEMRQSIARMKAIVMNAESINPAKP